MSGQTIVSDEHDETIVHRTLYRYKGSVGMMENAPAVSQSDHALLLTTLHVGVVFNCYIKNKESMFGEMGVNDIVARDEKPVQISG